MVQKAVRKLDGVKKLELVEAFYKEAIQVKVWKTVQKRVGMEAVE